MFRTIALVLLGMVSAVSADAGEFNSVLSIGDQAPVWNALPSASGRTLSMDDIGDAKVIVLVFTCNSCPYAIDIEDRLIRLHRDYAAKSVSLVAVNVNTIVDDALPAMKDKATERGFEFEYLYDQSQQIAKDYGAKYTPEFFVIGRDRKIAYMGSMDDSPDGESVSQRYVDQAIQACLEGGTPSVQETVPIGCRIRMQRQRRSRSK